MTSSPLTSFVHPGANTWTSPETLASAREFHRTLEAYQVSPLAELPAVAKELGVGRVFLKDESERLGLPAFKILGASWAVAKALALRCDLNLESVTLDTVREAVGDTSLTLVTATDGNHGRAVSHMARLLGLGARVYTPAGVSDAALDGIRGEGAELINFGGSYDDAVHAAAVSSAGNDAELLIQDTSWPGYEEVPRWIVEGYATLFSEIDEQLSGHGAVPDLVVIPTGVGSLLQSAVEYYRGVSEFRPKILSVEPDAAACVLKSLHAGEMRTVDTTAGTIMTGLCTGSVSGLAWPSLQSGLDAAIAVDDDNVRKAVSDLGEWSLDVGPCGAAPLAGIRKAFGEPNLRAALDLPESPSVVLLSTESLSANPLPA